ncbi:hypothetical protein [Streptosporangium canum]|uniref:hypothetical protein n=1 Tax=Streptosporangium canum TaxID=324952 RepID=UPI0034248208
MHAGLAVAGLSALIMHSSQAFTAVKLAGAAYLIGLATWTWHATTSRCRVSTILAPIWHMCQIGETAFLREGVSDPSGFDPFVHGPELGYPDPVLGLAGIARLPASARPPGAVEPRRRPSGRPVVGQRVGYVNRSCRRARR